jgi:putative hydrolase of the HAD superfamily
MHMSQGVGRFKAIFFDVGNTLLFPNYRLIELALSARGIQVSAEKLFWLDCALRDRYNRLSHAGQDASQLWDEHWENLLGEAGVPERLRAIIAEELKIMSDMDMLWTEVADGARELLGTLKAGRVALGVISNSEGRVDVFLRKAGLYGFFDFVIDSAVVGIRKPDRAIFQMALRMAGASPDRSLHVGDSYQIDVMGAREAGIRPALFSPMANLDGPFDCYVINRLDQIVQILDG